ncbi:diacylglycerol kinase family protein [Flagellimonas sp. CMM7]|uniref:diacylglycerol kinase family protein n=1 Tax=Flagellimonas sp. CMM7 TaxID=2654676 RepID=UPI0013D16120|nr:diacylglycerol kinase family protein [Flagellimonas sp. CMM7]UII79342.1 diacylglycerol kinase family protein [Flagellimonas sp. CMM7]
MPKESFLKNRIKSVGYAMKGMFLLLRTEASIKIQFVIALVVTGAGFHFNISNIEWMIQLIAIGMVMGIEGLNTAVEKLSDFVQPEKDPKIGFIKDVSAGAVMIVSILASIVGLLIYVPKLV